MDSVIYKTRDGRFEFSFKRADGSYSVLVKGIKKEERVRKAISCTLRNTITDNSYSGLSICHHKDKFDENIGKFLSLKDSCRSNLFLKANGGEVIPIILDAFSNRKKYKREEKEKLKDKVEIKAEKVLGYFVR